ncbi:MAG: ABC-2 type transport system ATP-binding protein [Desulfobacteraceae bacterium Eth-SRB2]|nr:MAG: ABC-2 type transport system ATP-binding protein [Desulfobacteraceae bacterium Eth-SRB2]
MILQINSLSKIYNSKEGKVEALKNLDLQVEEGEILGLLGPNGAGKTTAVKMIMGFLHPSGGEIRLGGELIEPSNPRRQIGYLPESFRPNPNLNVMEYLRFQCRLARPGGPRVRGEEDRLLERVGMTRFGKRRISKLSKGMGQRVGLAQAFAGDPSILILDEPTSGLDPLGKGDVIHLLLDMKAAGKTIFFCSHFLSEVERLCDRIGILDEGELKFMGTVKTFFEKWRVNDLEQAFRWEVGCGQS